MTQDSMLYMILKNSPSIPLIKAINLNKINSSKSKLIVEKKIDKMNDIIEKVQEQGEKPGQMIEDAVRIASEMAASIDPTGVSGIVSAYTYAECSKYFPTGNSKINNNQDSEEEEN